MWSSILKPVRTALSRENGRLGFTCTCELVHRHNCETRQDLIQNLHAISRRYDGFCHRPCGPARYEFLRYQAVLGYESFVCTHTITCTRLRRLSVVSVESLAVDVAGNTDRSASWWPVRDESAPRAPAPHARTSHQNDWAAVGPACGDCPKAAPVAVRESVVLLQGTWRCHKRRDAVKRGVALLQVA